MVKPKAKKNDNEKSKKQTTLFAYNYVKRVRQDGVLVNVGPSMEKVVADEEKIYKCSICDENFKTKPGQLLHKKWKHGRMEESQSTKLNAVLVESPHVQTNDMVIVQTVINKLVSDAVKVCGKVNEKKKDNRKGASVRKSYSYSFRMDVLNELEHGKKRPVDVAFEFGLNESTVSKWRRARKDILSRASDQHKRNMKKGRPSSKYNKLFEKLIVKFRTAREKGRMVSFSWLYTNASKLQKEINSNETKMLSPSVIVTFLRRYKIKLRRVQRRKQKPKSDAVVALQKWHMELREGLIKTGTNLPFYDPKWGRYTPERRWNVDQVPLPFAIDQSTTYEESVPKGEQRKRRVWVSQPSGGLEKRQCSLQVCFSPIRDKCRIAIIFRGTGKKISEDEIAAYHPDVDVYWQRCAWVDRDLAIEWLERTFKPAIKDLDEVLLFCDNLDAQTTAQFREKVTELNGRVNYGPKNLTDCWQMVDAGYGKLLKVLAKQEQQLWLESEENLDKWLGNTDEKFSAKERRILICDWIGRAHNKLQDPKYDQFRLQCFQKTGGLITADGSDDDSIKPEGIPDYSVPPPMAFSSDDPFAEVVPAGAEIPPDDIVDEDDDVISIGDENEIDHDDNDNCNVDYEQYRDFTHNLVGCTVSAFYHTEGGWFDGTVTWYNTSMDKLRVLFDDNSDDYISPDEIDGVDIKLL